jgi:hypothetical protein
VCGDRLLTDMMVTRDRNATGLFGAVIPRLDFNGLASRQPSRWPDPPNPSPRSPFQPRRALRYLRVMVDVDVLADDGTDPWSPQRLLAGLLHHPFLRVTRYSDAGPPADVPVHEVYHGEPKARGWVTPVDDPAMDPTSFWYSDGEQLAFTGYLAESTDWVARTVTGAYADLDSEDAAQARRRDAVALAIASAIGPDVFLTARLHLLDPSFSGRGLTVCDLRGGLALLGLYLRGQYDYRIWFDPGWPSMANLGKDMYFWVAARDLLPEAWRWVTACVQHTEGAADDTLRYLALSMLERMVQVLKNRDLVHQALNQPPGNGRPGSGAIDAFETALMMLMAALDITAVVAHRVLGLTGPVSYAGWQSTGWIARVTAVQPNLAVLVAPGTAARDALTIVQHLRNSIHGIALHGTDVQRGGHARRMLMGLPRAKQTELLTAINALGGPAHWGVEVLHSTDFHADPGILLDRLLPHLCDLLNAVMRKTPVENLANVSLSPTDRMPPQQGTGDVTDMFSAPQRACVRALLGL